MRRRLTYHTNMSEEVTVYGRRLQLLVNDTPCIAPALELQRNSSKASRVTIQGEIEVQKFLAVKGPNE